MNYVFCFVKKRKLFEYTVLEIQFQSVKYMVVTRIRKNFEQLLILVQAIQGDYVVQCVDVNNPHQTVFKRVCIVYIYSNCMINLLYC